jgi:hypothetical protein
VSNKAGAMNRPLHDGFASCAPLCSAILLCGPGFAAINRYDYISINDLNGLNNWNGFILQLTGGI